jgi:hypothetical protein
VLEEDHPAKSAEEIFGLFERESFRDDAITVNIQAVDIAWKATSVQ